MSGSSEEDDLYKQEWLVVKTVTRKYACCVSVDSEEQVIEAAKEVDEWTSFSVETEVMIPYDGETLAVLEKLNLTDE